MRTYSNFELENFNSYRIKSICSEVFFPDSEEEVINIFSRNEKFILLGSGHNVILSKKFYEESFVIFNGNFSEVKIDHDNHILEIEAGAFTKNVCELALENGLSGLEMFYDIPSSFGGAIVMNAGASGEEIKDVLVKVRYLDLDDMKTKELLRQDMSFQYRNSFFQRNTNKVILKIWIQLFPKDPSDIKEKMESIKEARWIKQPKEYPNAGSVFKRPEGFYVGALIDELNLKGYTVGGAKISEKHGGFIVNFNNATGEDILTIIQHVKREVKNQFGVDLEVEQRII